MADTVKVGPWGAPGGQHRDINPGSMSQHLTTITISWDPENSRIIGFSFVYVDQHEEPIPAGPWGQIDPENYVIIQIDAEERLILVSGTFDDPAGVTSLNLVTNQGEYGPYGFPAGPAFSVPLQQLDGEVVGEGVAFFGRSNDTLQALGVYVRGKDGLPVMIGPWGGYGGVPRDINTPVQLQSVTVYSAERIDGFSFTYVGENNHGNHTDIWGAANGQQNNFNLGPHEYVNNNTGSFDVNNGVNSLQFTTNQGNVHGPFGHVMQTFFSVPLPDNAVVRDNGNRNGAVLGFFGRSGGDGLVALGVYVGLAPQP